MFKFDLVIWVVAMNGFAGVGDEELPFLDQTTLYDDCLRSRKKPRFHNNSMIENSNTQDFISHLPDECIVEIFRFLPSYRDRCSCAAVSKKWLVLQAEMRSSEFKYNNISTLQAQNCRASRCLEGKKANDTSLAAMAVGICPRGGLTELCIKGSFPSQGITDFGLKIIAQACPSLKSLTLWDCPKVGSKGLVSIAHGCSWLERLDLLNSPSIGDEGLISIAKNCPNLLTLNLDSCSGIGNESLYALARYSSKLESISLIKCPFQGDEGIVSLTSSLPKLEKLKLVSLSANDDVLEAVGRHGKSLRTFCLENISSVSEVGFCSFGRLEKMEFLSLRSCTGLSDTSFKAIGAGFIGLKVISIRNCTTLSDKGLKDLTKSASLLESLILVECNNVTSKGLRELFMNCHKRLKVMCLVKCRGLKEEKEEANPNSIQSSLLPKCPFLESLTLNGCAGIGDSFLSWLGSACHQVRHLELMGLKSVTDRGVLTLLKALDTKNKALETVDLSGCVRLTDWSVLAITNAFGEKLRSLKLDGCERVSDRSLEMIAELCPCLVELDLSSCGISDAGVLRLGRSRSQCIEILSLAGCKGITDKSLHHIEMMLGTLVGLNIKQCHGLSKKEVDSVRDIIWWCDVLH